MAENVYVADIAAHEGQEVTLRGWLHNRRSSGKLHFLQVRDGTGTIQCVVFKGNVTPEVFTEADHLPQETSIAVTGLVKKEPRSPIGFEIDVRGLSVHARPTQEFPIGHKEHGVAFLMEQRHLWLRSPRQNVILRVRHTVEKAIRDFFDQRGFTLVDGPIFTPSACEGTSTLFEVPYFDLGKAYLTQSGQLYMEAGGHGAGQGLLLRPHLPRREVQDPPAPHRVLDGGAGGGLARPRRRHGAHGGVRLLRGPGGARQAPGRSSSGCWSGTSRSWRACSPPSRASPTPRRWRSSARSRRRSAPRSRRRRRPSSRP